MQKNIVIISEVHWHFTWQSKHNIAVGMLKRGHNVIYVEPLPKRWPKMTEVNRVVGRLSGKPENSGVFRQEVPEDLKIITPLMLPDTNHVLHWINKYIFLSGVIRQIRQKLLNGPLIIINYLPTNTSIELSKALMPDVLIYNCVWDWQNDPYIGSLEGETVLAALSDLVFADSQANIDRLKGEFPHVTYLGKGVDLSMFSGFDNIKQEAKPHPLCCYFGSIGANIDIDLLRAISYRYPLRLIGPSQIKLDGFSHNTDIIGAVRHDELPGLLEDVDVLLLPYSPAPHVKAVTPAKIFECLATGKPIVAINLPSISHMSDLIYICEGYKDFFGKIDHAFKEDNELKLKRIESAKNNSWDKIIDVLDAHINRVLVQKQTLQFVGKK